MLALPQRTASPLGGVLRACLRPCALHQTRRPSIDARSVACRYVIAMHVRYLITTLHQHLKLHSVSDAVDASAGGGKACARAGGTRQRSAGPQRAASWQQARQSNKLRIQRAQQSRSSSSSSRVRRMARPSPSGRQRSSRRELVRRPSARRGRRCPSSSVRRAPHGEVRAGLLICDCKQQWRCTMHNHHTSSSACVTSLQQSWTRWQRSSGSATARWLRASMKSSSVMTTPRSWSCGSLMQRRWRLRSGGRRRTRCLQRVSFVQRTCIGS